MREEYSQREKILQIWENEWNERDAPRGVFYDVFEEAYSETVKKVGKNKRWNFAGKVAFFALLIVSFIASAIVFCSIWPLFWSGVTQDGIEKTKMIVVPVAALFIAWLVSKWLDIKKYQETWARHEKNRYLMEQEMILYIYQLEPYHGENCSGVFMERVLGIWGRNQKKFSDNMENKEIPLTNPLKTLLDSVSEHYRK